MRRWAVAVALALVSAIAFAAAAKWAYLAKDEVHDPAGSGLDLLQEPGEALGALAATAPDTAGNLVRWMEVLDSGQIKPRTNILPETIVKLRTTDVLLKNTGEMPMVRFPHRQHTAWLDCSNCHDQLFAQQAGATRINMMLILAGEKCGLCHGAVAFPLTECKRCHSVERGSPEHVAFGKAIVKEATP